MFVDFFIKRPVFATVCALLIILAGAAVIPTLADRAVSHTGAAAGFRDQLLRWRQRPDRGKRRDHSPRTADQRRRRDEVHHLDAAAVTGSSSITATFDLNRDPDLAAVDIQNRVNTAQGRLPSAVKATGITITKASNNFVLGAAVFSPEGRYTPLFMSNYLDVYVKDSLKRVPGVADVIIFGERKYSMRLWLDPVRMASRGLTASDAVSALAGTER